MRVGDLVVYKTRKGILLKCIVTEVLKDYARVQDYSNYNRARRVKECDGAEYLVLQRRLRKLDPTLIYVLNPFKYANELNMQRLKQNRIKRMRKKLFLLENA